MAHASNRLGDYGKASELHLEVLKLGKAWDDPKVQAEAYANLGNVQYNSGKDAELAIDLYSKAMQHSTDQGSAQSDGALVARCARNIAYCCDRKGDRLEALHYQHLALTLSSGTGDSTGITCPHCVLHSGYVSLDEQAKRRTLVHFQQLLGAATAERDHRKEACAHGNLALALYQSHSGEQSAECLFHYERALTLIEQARNELKQARRRQVLPSRSVSSQSHQSSPLPHLAALRPDPHKGPRAVTPGLKHTAMRNILRTPPHAQARRAGMHQRLVYDDGSVQLAQSMQLPAISTGHYQGTLASTMPLPERRGSPSAEEWGGIWSEVPRDTKPQIRRGTHILIGHDSELSSVRKDSINSSEGIVSSDPSVEAELQACKSARMDKGFAALVSPMTLPDHE